MEKTPSRMILKGQRLITVSHRVHLPHFQSIFPGSRMVSFKFNKFFSSVLLAVLYSSSANALALAPPTTAKLSTHHVRDLPSGVKVTVFHPESDFKTFGDGLDIPPSFFPLGIEDKTTQFVSSQLNVDSTTVSFKSGYTRENGEIFGYAKQAHDGVPFVNAVANVVFKNNKVVSFGQSFVDTSKIADSKPTVDVSTVIPNVESTLQGKKNEIDPTIEYLALQDGTVALAHVFQVQNDDAGTWYEAYVDAHSGELLSVTDFVAHASYRVLPVWKMDPRDGLELLTNPALPNASPNGWHDPSGTTTQGNNVISFKGTQTNTTKESANGQVFDYTYDMTLNPTQGANIDAARTNGFYIINSHHDTLYQYGFTESAFNFQKDNFGKGGKGGDPVLMSVQDPSGTNNANFATPPDGQSGTCRMFIFTITTPNRDGVLQNDIPLHEMTHGLSNRLTGGGTARCLQTNEAQGMGEGWSDAVAEWFVRSDTPEITDFVTGTWVLNNTAGVRTKPYSTSMTVNPYTYSTLKTFTEVHDIGEVWANMLHNVYAQLVGAHGFSETARTNANGKEGNIVYLQLLVDALAIQPCNPTFPTARDAWIQADANRYAGANKCLLWSVFASRGLGVGAANHTDSFVVPPECPQ
ncbi:hypothetical protein L218DRAFT_474630 [Marasmius fiardii PR-910]|nr:hypothetical protein L218DRAFT_474630 [Marasmius fiardii PR-910]